MISMDKTYTTRDGRPVRLFCTDLKNPYPVLGSLTYADGKEETWTWDKYGKYLGGNDTSYLDLIEVIPPKVEKVRWAIIYSKNLRTGVEYHMGSSTYTSKEEAQKWFNNSINHSKVGVVEVKWEE